jgi:hypothetical protein
MTTLYLVTDSLSGINTQPFAGREADGFQENHGIKRRS